VFFSKREGSWWGTAAMLYGKASCRASDKK